MNDCDSIPGRLSLDLDHLLTSDESAQLEDDLARCQTYAPLAQAMREADRMLRGVPLLAPRTDLWRDIMSQIELSQQRRDQRLVGITFVLGGLLSLWPLVLVGLMTMLAVFVAVQPGVAGAAVSLLVSFLRQILTLVLAFGAVQRVIGVWVFPLFAAVASLGLLTVSIIWAQRLTTLRAAVAEA